MKTLCGNRLAATWGRSRPRGASRSRRRSIENYLGMRQAIPLFLRAGLVRCRGRGFRAARAQRAVRLLGAGRRQRRMSRFCFSFAGGIVLERPPRWGVACRLSHAFSLLGMNRAQNAPRRWTRRLGGNSGRVRAIEVFGTDDGDPASRRSHRRAQLRCRTARRPRHAPAAMRQLSITEQLKTWALRAPRETLSKDRYADLFPVGWWPRSHP